NQDSLNNFDITELASQNVTSSDLKSLLFQTGYLTIRSNYLDAFGSHGYYLDFPNLEVRRAFLFNLAMAYAPNLEDRVQAGNLISMIRNSASEGRTEQLIESLRIFLSCIPYDIQIKNEKYYQSLLVCVFKLLGLIVQSEVRTSSGRIDALIDAQCQMYVIEFKIDRSPDEALLQIKSKDYCLPFMHMKLTKTIHLLGIAFDSSKRNISDWKEELI
ncbi:MAG: PD-(D/E)XK nuclease domain-containing protein, partial [Sphaerochaetaceae bacterium]|nr:PD-(D/E)XK nuclease domain-containing protein [Sphaerochaetaceae bacterium]